MQMVFTTEEFLKVARYVKVTLSEFQPTTTEFRSDAKAY